MILLLELIWFNIVLCFLALRRNNKVYNYRAELLNQAAAAARQDVAHNLPYEWRFNAFQEVSYDQMFFKFWKPLSSFYPDLSFTEPPEQGRGHHAATLEA